MIFKRKITDYLLKWKNSTDKSPLIIKGLRQVGKTSIVKDFALNNYENVFFLDFRRYPSYQAIFNGDFDIDKITMMISSLANGTRLIPNSKFVEGKTLLIFDEIQDAPNARSSLKYFKEDGRYDVIATGSLLGIKGYHISINNFRGIGVGSEEHIEMKAMDFEEFLWAINVDQNLISIIKENYDKKKQIPTFIHELFIKLIREYIVIGGMPEVVKTFIETNDIQKARHTQKKILSNYEADFGIHLNAKQELITNEFEKAKIMEVFLSLPKQLAKENKKFQFKYINSKAKSITHSNAIEWLKDYGLIDICYNLSTIEQPLDYFTNSTQFKIYLSDIGLLVGQLEDDDAFKILSNDLSIGKGMIYENLIADAMHKNSKNLYYYSKSSGLEIDFVSKIDGETMLIEVKARDGNAKSAKTILNNSEYKVDGLIKLSSQNIGVIDNKITVPYYLSFYVLK